MSKIHTVFTAIMIGSIFFLAACGDEDDGRGDDVFGDASCSDGKLNGDEEGVDCGGSCAASCDVPLSCQNGFQDEDEEGADCGGSCPDECPNYEDTCRNLIQDDNENGVDCGGVCEPCVADPTCDDGEQNGDEEGVDCGGSCDACTVMLEPGQPCVPDSTEGICPNAYDCVVVSEVDAHDGRCRSLCENDEGCNEIQSCVPLLPALDGMSFSVSDPLPGSPEIQYHCLNQPFEDDRFTVTFDAVEVSTSASLGLGDEPDVIVCLNLQGGDPFTSENCVYNQDRWDSYTPEDIGELSGWSATGLREVEISVWDDDFDADDLIARQFINIAPRGRLLEEEVDFRYLDDSDFGFDAENNRGLLKLDLSIQLDTL